MGHRESGSLSTVASLKLSQIALIEVYVIAFACEYSLWLQRALLTSSTATWGMYTRLYTSEQVGLLHRLASTSRD